MYDLGNPGSSSASTTGCKPADDACQSNSITRHCLHGTCVGTYNSAKCICYPGYFGIRCDKGKSFYISRPHIFHGHKNWNLDRN